MARCVHGILLSLIPCEAGCSGPRPPLNVVTPGVRVKRNEAARKRRRKIGEGAKVAPELYTAFGKAGKL